MIGWLGGTLQGRRGAHLIIATGGVGYLVQVPAGVGAQCAVGDSLELLIHTRVREDAIALYGFEDETQLHTFEVLTSVSGVGPKVGVNILGAISPDDLAAAIETADLRRLKALPGVGKRLAERLAVELKDKLQAIPTGRNATLSLPSTQKPQRKGVWRDLASALKHLQFGAREIDPLVTSLEREFPEADLDSLVKTALNRLRRPL